MIRTEEAASRYRCPNDSSNCIGSRCMAWRWVPLAQGEPWRDAVTRACNEQDGLRYPNRQAAEAHVNANRADYGLPTEPTHGYCGLAPIKVVSS